MVEKIRLGTILERITRSQTVMAGAIYPMAGVRSFGRGAFEAPDLDGADTSYVHLNQLETGDVVYPKLMAWEGAFAVVDSKLSGHFVSPEFCTFTMDPEVVDAAYIGQVLKSEPFLAGVRQGAAGTNVRRRRLQPKVFLELVIPLPPIEEQRRIVERMEAYAVKAAKLESSKAIWALTSEQLHQKLVEPDAPRRRVGDLIELQRRKVDVEPQTDYREIGLRSFGRGVFHKLPVSGFELGTKKVYAISPGDLLVSNVFAWEGAVAVAGESESGFIGSHRFMTWTPKSDCVNVHYLATYFTSKMGIDLLRAASPGSAGRNKTLSISTFENLQIPLPDMEDQQRIAQSLQMQSRLSTLHAKRSTLATALPKAMRNEIFSSLV